MKRTLFTPTNIQHALSKEVSKTNKTPIALNELLDDLNIVPENTFDFDLLNTSKIFHITHIKNVCIDYRLRFLDLKFFKPELPQEAKDSIVTLENLHGTSLTEFKIMAPSALFRLNKTDDPLLFVPMGNDYFYLVHKWGNDLSPFRKLAMWPYKNIWNLLLTILAVSGVATLLTPMALFTKTNDATSFWMLYFFMFKAIAAIVLYSGFAMGKNFNIAIWNNRYNKS